MKRSSCLHSGALYGFKEVASMLGIPFRSKQEPYCTVTSPGASRGRYALAWTAAYPSLDDGWECASITEYMGTNLFMSEHFQKMCSVTWKVCSCISTFGFPHDYALILILIGSLADVPSTMQLWIQGVSCAHHEKSGSGLWPIGPQ